MIAPQSTEVRFKYKLRVNPLNTVGKFLDKSVLSKYCYYQGTLICIPVRDVRGPSYKI